MEVRSQRDDHKIESHYRLTPGIYPSDVSLDLSNVNVVSTANLCKRERDDKREEEESKRDENRGRTTSTSISWGNALMKRLIGS